METQICLSLEGMILMKSKRPETWKSAIFNAGHQKYLTSTFSSEQVHILISPIGSVIIKAWSFTDILISIEELVKVFPCKIPENIDLLFITKVPIPSYYIYKQVQDDRIEISDNYWILKYKNYDEKTSLLKHISAGQNFPIQPKQFQLNFLEWAILGSSLSLGFLNLYYKLFL
jgi:hypothetical protein